MRSVRSASFAVIAAVAPLIAASPLHAQEAAQPAAPDQAPPAAATPDDVMLPEISVETEAAPAKRNKKKQALKAGTGTGAPSTTALPGIVVEGEKVVRSLADTTTSIGVVNGRQIREEQIQDLQEALNTQANVIAPEGSRGNAGFSIRGVSSEGLTQNQSAGASPAISVVIDGATQNPEATRRGARGLWDVEQVEVLRGPQSTLQARNSIGGTVFIKTNDPTYKQQVIVEGTAGGDELGSGGFVVNAPIVTGQMALRISGQAFERDHDITYVDPNDAELDDDRLRTFRAKLLIEPDSVSGLSALFTVARTYDRPGVSAVTGPDFFDRVFDSSANLFALIDYRETTTTNYISDISYAFNPGVSLRSITAYASTELEIESAGGSLFSRVDERNGGDFTQDLRLEIDQTGNGLSGVVGLFYGSFKNDTDAFLDLANIFFPPPPDTFVLQDLVIATDTQSIAAYADLRYRFFNDFVLIGGGRVLKDNVKVNRDGTVIPNPFNPFGDVPVKDRFDQEYTEALPRIGLTYDLAVDQTVGVTYNKGYRAGFAETRIANGDFTLVAPEYVDAYEVLYRSQWLHRTLSFNANAFYYDYRDQQVALDDAFPATTFIVNAPSSHAYGAELEARWRPKAPLQLYSSLGLLRTEFDNFSSPNGDFTGNEYPESPAYTVAAGAMYKDSSGWFAGANMRHTDGYYSVGNLANDPLRFVDGYTTVDVRTGWEFEHYTLTVFAKNVFNEQYVTSIEFGAAEATVGDERLVGVTLNGRF